MTNKLIFTGENISAETAKEMGLLLSVLPNNEEAFKFAMQFAGQINNLSVYSIIAAKKAIRFSANESSVLANQNESLVFNSILGLEGAKEGMRAFSEKRKADFKEK